MGTFAQAATPLCRQEIAKSLAILKERCAGLNRPARKSYVMPCWHDVPELYRKMIAHAAGLPRDVVGKIDRDLTEREKAALRGAAREMMEVAGRLVSI